jgi:hypothetical protein
VIVRRYSTVFLLPPQSFTHQGFIFRQIQEQNHSKVFALKSTGFYVNIVQGFCKASYHVSSFFRPQPVLSYV